MRLGTVVLINMDGRRLFTADGESSHLSFVQVGDEIHFEQPVEGRMKVRQRLFKMRRQDNGVWVADLHLLVKD